LGSKRDGVHGLGERRHHRSQNRQSGDLHAK
jgi:hypothetical protein